MRARDVIKSFLDTDFYKFTMAQAALFYAPEARVEYKFFQRRQCADFSRGFSVTAREVAALSELRFTGDDLLYLKSLEAEKGGRLFHDSFLRFLSGLRIEPDKEVVIRLLPGGGLDITVKGLWPNVIWYETMILSLVSEIYFHGKAPGDAADTAARITEEKALKFNAAGLKFSEFGTRRRFSFDVQDRVIRTLKKFSSPDSLAGTSNVFFAREHGLRPVGTMAHEWQMAHQAFAGLEQSVGLSLTRWLELYKNSAGIALSDTLGSAHFLSVFDKGFAEAFAGVRQDSGDPADFAERMIKHWENLGVDPKSKIIIFSDCLNTEKALELHDRFKDRCLDRYGIGTFLTNDVGVTPLDIVIKMVRCDGHPLIKRSDSPDKIICEDENLRAAFL
jgi:nicotinate phosphoribosyltransferase